MCIRDRRGIMFDNDGQDEVVGMICIKDLETESVMVVSEQGYLPRITFNQKRYGNITANTLCIYTHHKQQRINMNTS